MASLHSLLAIYGAIDQQVGAGGADVAEIVERYLPGTTGPEQGWYAQIQRFVANMAGDPPPLPDLDDALRDFGFEGTAAREQDQDTLGAPLVSRLVYAIGVLARLPEFSDGRYDGLFAEALALAGPEYARAERDIDRGSELLNLLRSDFIGRGQWEAVLQKARSFDAPLISEKVSRVPPVCLGATTIIDGTLSTELVSEFSDPNADFEKVKKVIDPRYWPKCCQFFCKMTRLSPDHEPGWYRYLEEVSPLCGYYYMRTALQFWKELITADVAVVEYDLDPHRIGTGDTGDVIVDHGYLEATNTYPGVAIRTSKVVAIDGMDPVASAFWSCILGWADIGYEMLLGCAATVPDDAAPGDPWVMRPSGAGTPATPTKPAKPVGSGPTIGLPEGAGQQLVTKTVNLLIDCIDEVSAQTAALASKASKGQATPEDLAAYSASIGARIASDPWRFLDALAKPTVAPRPIRPPRPKRPPRPTAEGQS